MTVQELVNKLNMLDPNKVVYLALDGDGNEFGPLDLVSNELASEVRHPDIATDRFVVVLWPE